MKKTLFVLCTALCFPFFSCSNDDATDDELLTRGEIIESQYQETLQYYVGLLEANGFKSENKYESRALMTAEDEHWEAVSVTAEKYVDGKKVEGDWNGLLEDNTIANPMLDYYQIKIFSDKSFIITHKDWEFKDTYKTHWSYFHNMLLTIAYAWTLEEWTNFYQRNYSWLFNNKDYAFHWNYYPTDFYEVVEASSDRLVLKVQTFVNPPVDGGLSKLSDAYWFNQKGTYYFCLLEYRKVKD